MGLDDLMSTESAFVAAATAALFSPRTRETMRRGAVIGVAGALRAGDVVVGAARGVARGVKGDERPVSSNGGGATASSKPATQQRTATRRRSTSSGRSGGNSKGARSTRSRSAGGSSGSRSSSSA